MLLSSSSTVNDCIFHPHQICTALHIWKCARYWKVCFLLQCRGREVSIWRKIDDWMQECDDNLLPFLIFTLFILSEPREIDVFFGSTAFLMGPEQQLNMMLDPVRLYATSIYIGCVVVALICALLVSSCSLIQETKLLDVLKLSARFNPTSVQRLQFVCFSILISFKVSKKIFLISCRSTAKFWPSLQSYARFVHLFGKLQPKTGFFFFYKDLTNLNLFWIEHLLIHNHDDRYSLSYIPFARRMVSEIMIRLCDTEL